MGTRDTDKLAAEPGYHNPNPLVQLIGYANEAMGVVEVVEAIGLGDTGSHVSTVTEGFCVDFLFCCIIK